MFSASENPAPVAKPYTMASIVNPILLSLMSMNTEMALIASSIIGAWYFE